MTRAKKLFVIWTELNEKHFGGRLEPVPIRVTRSRRTYGYFNAPNNGGQPSIRISTVLADTAELVRDTMAHEMIHQALYVAGAEDWDQHAEAFQAIHKALFNYPYIE